MTVRQCDVVITGELVGVSRGDTGVASTGVGRRLEAGIT